MYIETIMIKDKRVLLILSGGIAAYKCHELIRLIKRAGGHVTCLMTKSAENFVTPMTLQALSEERVYTNLFSLTDENEMGHIRLSRIADVVLVAPATADIMAKMAHGIADDLATTALLATDKDVIVAPAMNVRMWDHPATQDNLNLLQSRGVKIINPREGDMACGEYGIGRLAEPEDIFAYLTAYFAKKKRLTGKTAIVTAGPTHEPIDPVRFIANHSSGKQGYAIAGALAESGAKTILISGPTHLDTPRGVEKVSVTTAQEMLKASKSNLPADIAIFSAAVCDWSVKDTKTQKIKKDAVNTPPNLEFEENPDILATISQLNQNRPELVIGFAAETENVLQNAKDKQAHKKCDWIVANDVSPDKGVFGEDENTVHLISTNTQEDWPTMKKGDVAQKLVERIADFFDDRASQ